jgi:hypothetical protein
MNRSDPAAEFAQEIDGTLAALASVQPRDGLEQRVLARLASAPAHPWYRRLAIAPGQNRWMLAAASAVIVAGGVTTALYQNHPAAAPAPAPVATHVPRPAQQPAAAAASIGVSDHPLQTNTTRTRHRGIHRTYRAIHGRVPLPRGTAVPMRPLTIPNAPQQ